MIWNWSEENGVNNAHHDSKKICTLDAGGALILTINFTEKSFLFSIISIIM